MDEVVELNTIKSAEEYFVGTLVVFREAMLKQDVEAKNTALEKLKQYLVLARDGAFNFNESVEGRPVFHHVVAYGCVTICEELLRNENRAYQFQFDSEANHSETVLHALVRGELAAWAYVSENQLAAEAMSAFTDMAVMVLNYADENIAPPVNHDQDAFIIRRNTSDQCSALHLAASGAPKTLAELLKRDIYLNQPITKLEEDTPLRLVIDKISQTDDAINRDALQQCVHLLCEHGAAIGVRLPRLFFSAGVQLNDCPMFFVRSETGQLLTHVSAGLNSALLDLPDWVHFFHRQVNQGHADAVVNKIVLRCLYEAEDYYQFTREQLEAIKVLQTLFQFFTDPRFASSHQRLFRAINDTAQLQLLATRLNRENAMDLSLRQALNELIRLLPQFPQDFERGFQQAEVVIPVRMSAAERRQRREALVEDYERLQRCLGVRHGAMFGGGLFTGLGIGAMFILLMISLFTSVFYDVPISYFESESCISYYFKHFVDRQVSNYGARSRDNCFYIGDLFLGSSIGFIGLVGVAITIGVLSRRFTRRERDWHERILASSTEINAPDPADNFGDYPPGAAQSLATLITRHRGEIDGFARHDPVRGRDDIAELPMGELPEVPEGFATHVPVRSRGDSDPASMVEMLEIPGGRCKEEVTETTRLLPDPP